MERKNEDGIHYGVHAYIIEKLSKIYLLKLIKILFLKKKLGVGKREIGRGLQIWEIEP